MGVEYGFKAGSITATATDRVTRHALAAERESRSGPGERTPHAGATFVEEARRHADFTAMDARLGPSGAQPNPRRAGGAVRVRSPMTSRIVFGAASAHAVRSAG